MRFLPHNLRKYSVLSLLPRPGPCVGLPRQKFQLMLDELGLLRIERLFEKLGLVSILPKFYSTNWKVSQSLEKDKQQQGGCLM